MSRNVSLPPQAGEVNRRVTAAGGTANAIGGSVIDGLHDREVKDLDVEVFGLGWRDLVSCFQSLPTKEVGAEFGILKVVIDGLEVDVSIPRSDNRVGVGHAGFEVSLDPRMTEKEAARRRDFTINTLSADCGTGEVKDFWGGLADLEAGILRATDPELFSQDILRGLRAMQLLARKAKTVDPSTMRLIRGMASEFHTLPPERVWEEFAKLFLKADRPSVGLQFLEDSGWVLLFPHLDAMRGCGQHPIWHPEGTVWTHALQAADAAAQLRSHLPEEDRLVIVMAAFLHDIGKPATTVTPAMVASGEHPASRVWSAHGHDTKGVKPADAFLQQLTGPKGRKAFRAKVTGLVREHMQPFGLVSGNAGEGAWTRLHNRLAADGLTLRHLGSICQCDACGTGRDTGRSLEGGAPNWEHRTSEACFEWAEKFENAPPAPLVKGRHLMEAGIKPGPAMGDLVRSAHELQMDNPTWTVEQLVAAVLNTKGA